MATPYHKNPCSGGHELFVDPTLVIITFFWFVWSMHGRKCIFTIWHIWPCPGKRTPEPKSTIVDPSWVIITNHSLSEPYPGIEKKILKKKYINLIFLITSKLSPLWGVGFMKFIISCLITLKMLHTKFG